MDSEAVTHADTMPLACELVSMAGMAKRLEWQSHIAHLTYQGADFLSVHEFLKERYDTHLGQFDTLAELVRTMGFGVPMGRDRWEVGEHHDQFEELSRGESSQAMLSVYLRNLELFGAWTKSVEAMAQKCQAIDVANVMADLCGDAWKAAWMLKSVLSEA